MDKSNFEQLEGKFVKLLLKPNGFKLNGKIDKIYPDCFQFTTKQQSSFIEYDAVMSVIWTED